MHATKTFRRRSATICRRTRRKYSAMPSTMLGRPTVSRRALKKSHIGLLGRRSKSAIRNWVRSGCHAKRHRFLVGTTHPFAARRILDVEQSAARAQGCGRGLSPAATSVDPTAPNAFALEDGRICQRAPTRCRRPRPSLSSSSTCEGLRSRPHLWQQSRCLKLPDSNGTCLSCGPGQGFQPGNRRPAGVDGAVEPAAPRTVAPKRSGGG